MWTFHTSFKTCRSLLSFKREQICPHLTSENTNLFRVACQCTFHNCFPMHTFLVPQFLFIHFMQKYLSHLMVKYLNNSIIDLSSQVYGGASW
jgi:hypothetical protein